MGRLIADKLGIKFYDKELIVRLAEETGLSEEYVENSEQKNDGLLNNGYYFDSNNANELFFKETEIINEIANKDSCVIIGRCSDFILKDRENVIKVFIYSDMEGKLKRATKFYGLNKEKAEKEIKRIDKLRGNHYKYYTKKEWTDHSNYDICINSDILGVEKTADFICELVKVKEKELILQ